MGEAAGPSSEHRSAPLTNAPLHASTAVGLLAPASGIVAEAIRRAGMDGPGGHGPVRLLPGSHGVQTALALQRTVGNAGMQQALAPALARAPRTVQRDDPPIGPPAPAPAAQETAAFDPEFKIEPGGLIAGKVARSQQQVFRGDTLVFTAKVQNVPENSTTTVGGRVVGDSPGTGDISGGVATWRVVVGKMGVLGKPGESPALVDAIPTLELPAPLVNAGKKLQKSYQFRVVADMAWLSDQCNIAGGQLSSAVLGLKSLVAQAYLNYDEAYKAHAKAVDDHGKRKQLTQDILLGVLLAGIGGAVGGHVADLLKSQKQDAATATAVGDVYKYVTRLAGAEALGPGSGPKPAPTHGPETPNPTQGTGTAKAAGVAPERWKAMKEKECDDAAKAATDACNALRVKLSEAWAQGRTDMMDMDPIQVVEPTIKTLQEHVDVKGTKDYAIELWRTWLRTYGITATPNWAGGKTRNDETKGFFAWSDSDLFDDIHKQVGPAVDDEVNKLRAATAPDPLTEMPD